VLSVLPQLLRAALPAFVGTEALALPLAPADARVAAIAAMVPTGRAAVLLAIGRDAREGAFLPEDLAFLLGYVRMASLALDRLVVTERIEGQVQDTVGALLRAIEASDPALRGHAARVSLYAGEIGTYLGMPERQLAVTRRASLLHDLGKLTVLETVLGKPGRLTPAEYALVKRHPLAAERMLRSLPALAEEATVVRHHAERYDGTGYPDGRKAGAIPLPARIVAVADAFDAMTSLRPYRAPRPLDAARAEILQQAGRQFDPTVAAAFSAIPAARLAEFSRFDRSAHTAGVAPTSTQTGVEHGRPRQPPGTGR
jgi:HD-GYP domain-containing protein (c-di-GMP phosphodiesterase class II)